MPGKDRSHGGVAPDAQALTGAAVLISGVPAGRARPGAAGGAAGGAADGAGGGAGAPASAGAGAQGATRAASAAASSAAAGGGTGAPADARRSFRAVDPSTGEALEPAFRCAELRDVDRAARAAAGAAAAFGATAARDRARFLHTVADELDAQGPVIIARANRETALGVARLTGELGRTTNQLRMFAAIVAERAYVDARIDRGDTERAPAPKPDVRSLRVPLGPVAVFGASNFPLAFSVAGGDTAAALAAGCPVVAKAHPAHPGTSELVGRAIAAAAEAAGLPAGTFSLLLDDGYAVGQALVQHPDIRAVGFTGSRAGGRALMRLAAERDEPIPVYAEMSSVNPLVVLPAAAAARAQAIADGLFASFTLGVGQFCTNPGVVLLPAGAAGDAVRDRLAARTRDAEPGTMLTAGICEAYGRGLEALREAGAREIARGRPAPDGPSGRAVGRSAVWEADLAEVLGAAAHGGPALLAEVFGPSTLLLRYADVAQVSAFASAMEGQLTATIHGEPDELERHGALAAALARRVGRLIFNQFPTGVEVTDAMVHGGPYPATSDGRGTSVGGRALLRFTRLLAYQNAPQALLPAALRDR